MPFNCFINIKGVLCALDVHVCLYLPGTAAFGMQKLVYCVCACLCSYTSFLAQIIALMDVIEEQTLALTRVAVLLLGLCIQLSLFLCLQLGAVAF